MARRAWAAPATTGKTPAKVEKLSIRDMSGASRDDFKPGAGWLIPCLPITVPTTPFDKAKQQG